MLMEGLLVETRGASRPDYIKPPGHAEHTQRAGAGRPQRANALAAVAPVVKTSSTMTTWRPATRATPKAPRGR